MSHVGQHPKEKEGPPHRAVNFFSLCVRCFASCMGGRYQYYRSFALPSNREKFCDSRSPSYGDPSTVSSSIHAAWPAGRARSWTPSSRSSSTAAKVKVSNEEVKVMSLLPAVANELPSSPLSPLSAPCERMPRAPQASPAQLHAQRHLSCPPHHTAIAFHAARLTTHTMVTHRPSLCCVCAGAATDYHRLLQRLRVVLDGVHPSAYRPAPR